MRALQKHLMPQVISVLAELETMSIPQRAMVVADLIGRAAGAHGAATGTSTEESIAIMLRSVCTKMGEARSKYPVN